MTTISVEIQRFSEKMQFKLDKNKHKDCKVMNYNGTGRRWADCDYDWLLLRLREETEELNEALILLDTAPTPDTIEAAVYECADVANFAMMIADKLTTL